MKQLGLKIYRSNSIIVVEFTYLKHDTEIVAFHKWFNDGLFIASDLEKYWENAWKWAYKQAIEINKYSTCYKVDMEVFKSYCE